MSAPENVPDTLVYRTPLMDAIEKAGVTYRQADYWRRKGYLTVEYADRAGFLVDVEPGDRMTGYVAYLNTTEALALRTMARLVKVGLKPEVAASAARQVLAGSDRTVDLGDGVTLRVGT